MVLTGWTVKVTANRPDAQNTTTRHEVQKRAIFDIVDTDSGGSVLCNSYELVVYIFLIAAQTYLIFIQLTEVLTDQAGYIGIVLFKIRDLFS